MMTPQECLSDFRNNKYLEANSDFLLPIYDKLFRDMSDPINISSELIKAVEFLKNYFDYLNDLKIKNNIKFSNKQNENKKEIVEKLVDLIDKKNFKLAINSLNNMLFIGAHKEQQQTGGAQDNQAEDAQRVFDYGNELIGNIQEKYNVSEVYRCIILDAEYSLIVSGHWKLIFDQVDFQENEEKYLLNSVQFIELIKSIG